MGEIARVRFGNKVTFTFVIMAIVGLVVVVFPAYGGAALSLGAVLMLLNVLRRGARWAWEDFGLDKPLKALRSRRVLLLIVFGASLLILNNMLFRQFFLQLAPKRPDLFEHGLAPYLFNGIVAAPLAEEIIFRGLFLGLIIRWFKGRFANTALEVSNLSLSGLSSVAPPVYVLLLLQAVLFGLGHGSGSVMFLYGVDGLIFGCLFLVGKTLYVPIGAHMLKNATAGALFFL